MKILHVGDIVGSPGRTAFARVVTDLRNRGKVDVVVANAENVAGGRGLTPRLAEELFAAGADAMTLGDHTWDQRELAGHLPKEPRIVRPGNFAEQCPGQGYTVMETEHGAVAVMQMIGRVFMNPYACPFAAADRMLKEIGARTRVILAEIHAEATSEKIAMGRHLDGRVSAVAGTHTHVQTADERILPGGTAYITDLGMTGPIDSVLGRAIEPVLHRFRTGMPAKFDVADGAIALQGVLLDIDENTGKARKIQRVWEDAGTV
jgi:metallophosphoesterase (TIGR00282 family)